MFNPNETVYAYHGPLIYEAKVVKTYDVRQDKIFNSELKVESPKENLKFNYELFKSNKEDGYLLHYQGWNSKWDEWVNHERVLAFNDVNKFKKMELDQLNKRRKVKATLSGTATSPSPSSGSKRKDDSKSNGSVNNKKQKLILHQNGSNGSGSSNKGILLQLEFNIQLKYLLINDWEYITKDKQIISLPSSKPINTILQDYKTWRNSQLTSEDQRRILDEILLGLEVYFNKSLSLMLLYKYENLQYLEFLKKDLINNSKPQSKVYGIEHLLRLLISLPGLLSDVSMDSISISVLINELKGLLDFLKNNLGDYVNEYVNTSPQYDSLARA
ncbi:MRG-domain-containing protein [Scheffersomyces amazonensis]|uniref:MRG-domain-containing protein n=1 Tax=Scheffersomyces amazonensis TaxID=1078765 RepID=UPI00315D89AE